MDGRLKENLKSGNRVPTRPGKMRGTPRKLQKIMNVMEKLYEIWKNIQGKKWLATVNISG